MPLLQKEDDWVASRSYSIPLTHVLFLDSIDWRPHLRGLLCGPFAGILLEAGDCLAGHLLCPPTPG